ncbi:MAG: glycosyltransferase [Paracoccaceae bacterium]
MRVAFVHYWLVNMRGGEYVLEQLSDLFPQADIFTHVVDRSKISEKLAHHQIIETSIAKLPAAKKHYQKYLMFMPKALEELDLREYDLVISSESGPAKGIVTRPDATHICYVHSPMRYIWDLYPEYRNGLTFPTKQVFSATAHKLRQWDYTSAQRVDHVIANSKFVAQRVNKFWNRTAEILNPPVDLSRFTPNSAPDDFYLFVSELVPYKRADLALEAFRELGAKLRIVGSGSELKHLQADAPDNVEFLGRVSNEELNSLYANCRALIFPGEEDFGIVPLEAMASGRPVIAYGKGGILDTVIPGKTGLFFHDQTKSALIAAIKQFEAASPDHFDPVEIAKHVQDFSPESFREKLRTIIEREANLPRTNDPMQVVPVPKAS